MYTAATRGHEPPDRGGPCVTDSQEEETCKPGRLRFGRARRTHVAALLDWGRTLRARRRRRCIPRSVRAARALVGRRYWSGCRSGILAEPTAIPQFAVPSDVRLSSVSSDDLSHILGNGSAFRPEGQASDRRNSGGGAGRLASGSTRSTRFDLRPKPVPRAARDTMRRGSSGSGRNGEHQRLRPRRQTAILKVVAGAQRVIRVSAPVNDADATCRPRRELRARVRPRAAERRSIASNASCTTSLPSCPVAQLLLRGGRYPTIPASTTTIHRRRGRRSCRCLLGTCWPPFCPRIRGGYVRPRSRRSPVRTSTGAVQTAQMRSLPPRPLMLSFPGQPTTASSPWVAVITTAAVIIAGTFSPVSIEKPTDSYPTQTRSPRDRHA